MQVGANNLEMSEDERKQDPPSNLQYITAGLTKGAYILVCLAIDVFVVLQIYDWRSTPTVAVLSIALLILFTAVELWAYKFVGRFVSE